MLALGLALVLGLCACSGALQQINTAGSPRPIARAIVPPRNDLAAGALTKTISAGDADLTVVYSSRLPADRWSAAEEKPLDIRVSAELTSGAGRRIFLALLGVRYSVTGDSGVLPAPAPFIDRVFGVPGFDLDPTAGYSQTLMLPPLEADAEAVRVKITYVVLLEAVPGSARFVRQTVMDDLTIAIAR